MVSGELFTSNLWKVLRELKMFSPLSKPSSLLGMATYDICLQCIFLVALLFIDKLIEAGLSGFQVQQSVFHNKDYLILMLL